MSRAYRIGRKLSRAEHSRLSTQRAMLEEADKHREDVPVGEQWQPIRVPSTELIQQYCSTEDEVDEFCRGWIEGSAALPPDIVRQLRRLPH